VRLGCSIDFAFDEIRKKLPHFNGFMGKSKRKRHASLAGGPFFKGYDGEFAFYLQTRQWLCIDLQQKQAGLPPSVQSLP
jgi:hypothetical protein